ncbi:MAG TPA: MCP four helix bundle domain-containing protein, partial [Spirochaetota bacterium]|nr:MCP four helix bundle domain-containing protein [Spirochaetota bacterium]
MKFKIGAKLLMGFISLTLITIVIGIISIISLLNVTKSNEDMYKKMVIPITYLTHITERFQRIRVNTRDIIIANSKEEIKNYEVRITEHRNEVEKYAKLYEDTLLTQAGRDLMKEFYIDHIAYKDGVAKLIKLAEENKDEEAFAYLQGDLKILSDKKMATIEKLIAQKEELAKERYIEDAKLSNFIILVLIISIAVGAVLALTIGIF